jgi:hypothetical protein
MEPAAPRRVVEESLGDSVIRAIDDFVFRDIEDQDTAMSVFEFVDEAQVRTVLATSLRGARWQQKVGLVLARHKGHPAHAIQIRSQVIEYGAIAELLLREVVRQEGPAAVPTTFKGLIDQAGSAGMLDDKATAAANRLRDGRNRVHHDSEARPLKIADAANALKDLTLVINQCRSNSGLPPWAPVRPAKP